MTQGIHLQERGRHTETEKSLVIAESPWQFRHDTVPGGEHKKGEAGCLCVRFFPTSRAVGKHERRRNPGVRGYGSAVSPSCGPVSARSPLRGSSRSKKHFLDSQTTPPTPTPHTMSSSQSRVAFTNPEKNHCKIGGRRERDEGREAGRISGPISELTGRVQNARRQRSQAAARPGRSAFFAGLRIESPTLARCWRSPDCGGLGLGGEGAFFSPTCDCTLAPT